MATLLYRLGKTAYRRWPIFLAGWLVALVGLGAVAGYLSKPMSNTFSIPGIESVEAAELQQELFPDAAAVDAPSSTIVVAAPEGEKLVQEPYAAAVQALVADLAELEDVQEGVVGPVEAAAGLEGQVTSGIDQAEAQAKEAGQPFDRDAALAGAQSQIRAATPLSEDGRVGTIAFTFDVPTVLEVTPEMQDAVTAAMDDARDAGLTVEVSGSAMQSMESGGASAELIGIALALVILALTFGSLVAAGMPIVTAGIGVGIGITAITAMTAITEIPSSTTALASMLGLAVGIDYALFILARYRSELDHTDDREEAIGVAVGTAGSAVVFAGLTVIIALVALSVVGISFLTAMGLGAAATVTVAVLVALTLLPAILGMLKSKAFGGTFRRYRPAREANGHILNNGVRWARFLRKAPLAWVLLVVVGLGLLAVPVKNMHLALPTDSTAAEDTTQRKASDLVTDAFGPGRLSPMLLVVDGRGLKDPQEQQAAYQAVTAWAAGQDDVADAMTAAANDKGAMILLQPASGAEDTETEELLESLRDGEQAIEQETGTRVGVTGLTAIQADVSKMLADALPLYLAIVIGLAFVLLVMVFRSLLVPLTATLGFLLSVMATLGATVAIFQEGMFGLFPGQPIVSFIPIFLIGVVFGLAMDYQVFLVTRIREAHVHGASYREAVVDGFRNSARVVTAAALIMTSVFAGFIFMDEPIVQSMGFALAAAVIFDAFIVRLVLIPALMYLMGEKAWYLPKWLDRIIPNVDIEGENLHRPHLEEHYSKV
ncbi:MMPL family transporter [Aeromicrobium duanguangcaii]|uniref:MMPL family transporter n=1 Tax=Aeromicrobium duanguangcaii TaxID=2968086 RepID=A0ABY5KFS2_9ACTN|nr:MMPL family transporter [Aeromicrobium duanguangcaii]MCD9154320.1 MMPL family transporter [Aeromicrobium duanguangcaii]MCL3838066.1 MMPL family transporter [Aeromicrobium duanguangcaii]UUI68613.1 MMPL family transporter [Aeromicrobium duanguangcaii]